MPISNGSLDDVTARKQIVPAKAKTAFITGIAGFAGSYLAEELLNAGYRVAGAVYPGESTENLSEIKSDLELVRLDIRNADKCRQVISKVRPYVVCHLAAFASVARSFRMEQEVYRVNLEGTLNMLQAARDAGPIHRFLFISSPDCYGIFHPKNKTLTERQPLSPVSPYGISKAAAEQTSLYFFRQYRLPVVVARAFNHSGPRQSEHFVIPSFARQIAMIEAHRRKPVISVGNLSAKRDLSDVRDVTRGYRLMVQRGRPGELYQLCTGRAVSIRTVLDRLLNLSARQIKVKTEKSRLRKADIPILRGDNTKAVQELGYKPRYTLITTLKDTLDYWRDRVRHT